jgi:DNA polymerase/3'-5' exonuclease PolX
LELEQADAYRKAAWAVGECAESVVEIYRQNGEVGLQKFSEIGKSLAAEIVRWL